MCILIFLIQNSYLFNMAFPKIRGKIQCDWFLSLSWAASVDTRFTCLITRNSRHSLIAHNASNSCVWSELRSIKSLQGVTLKYWVIWMFYERDTQMWANRDLRVAYISCKGYYRLVVNETNSILLVISSLPHCWKYDVLSHIYGIMHGVDYNCDTVL